MKRIFLFAVLLIAVRSTAQTLIAEKAAPTTFSLDRATIYVDPSDHALVQLSARLLQSDIEAVTGKKLPISHAPANAGNMIVIGSLDRSSYIQKVVKNKRIDEAELKGKWEGYLLQVLSQPQAGNALIIAGSDRRGTAYGVFEFSKQIGVSPWYWWADVPVSKKQSIHINKGVKITDAPKVKYRGIFINDEAPALSNWSKEKFGGFNHHFYEKVFELMLRLKSNYIWPAMWGNAFYYDDSLNIKTADEYGIVIGTSHHEPLMRAHEEWKYSGKGKKWNYDSTETGLKEFWKGGMQRATNEKIVSVGMRGDGDEPMSRETATALLERIVKDQRQIIADVTGKPAEQTPQLWALYKEVQDYYDKGMRVPDDVTLLLCDDNWGNIRKLPKLDEKPRKGGYGIYYHFDYVGGPRNYKWVNTNPIPRVWEQMHMAWEYKARQIWIVNAGDIKPMEFPISFFLDYAWNPEKIGPDDLQQYTEQWTAAQFGKEHAKDIADILSKYAKYNSRRKPELLDDKTYNFSGGEWYSVTEEWKALLEKAEYIGQQLEPAWKDAYFQLVLHPVKACANLNEMYHDLAVNKYYASQNLAETNLYADSVKILYEKDSLITQQYHQLNKGKWNYMMSQAHIGYTYWQQPPQQKMPAITYLSKDSILDSLGTERFRTRKEMFWPWANPSGRNIFYTLDYMVSMDASHYSQAVNSNGIKWTILPDHGRTGSAVTSFPVAAKAQQPGKNAPHLQYDVYINKRDTFNLLAYFSPTLNIHNTPEGLQYAISVDDEVPQIISINKDDTITGRGIWGKWVSENIIIKTTRHKVLQPGTHTVKYWMVNSGVVLQKIVLELGVRPSYLGPPETLWHAGLEVRDED